MAQIERKFTAKDLRAVTGLSYRQANDWESRGALPSASRSDSQWRKYTLREIFVLMVTAEIRKRFGTPVESLRWLQQSMLQDGVDHLAASIELMATLGVSVHLLTDLRETFILTTELEFRDLFRIGWFGGDDPTGYVLLKINPLVNRLLACLDEPIQLKQHGLGHRIRAEARRQHTAANRQELQLLGLVRNRDFRRVEIRLTNGSIKRIDVEQDIQDIQEQELLQVIAKEEFQTVTVTRQNGKIVRLTRRVPIKVKPAVPTKRVRRRKPSEPDEEA